MSLILHVALVCAFVMTIFYRYVLFLFLAFYMSLVPLYRIHYTTTNLYLNDYLLLISLVLFLACDIAVVSWYRIPEHYETTNLYLLSHVCFSGPVEVTSGLFMLQGLLFRQSLPAIALSKSAISSSRPSLTLLLQCDRFFHCSIVQFVASSRSISLQNSQLSHCLPAFRGRVIGIQIVRTCAFSRTCEVMSWVFFRMCEKWGLTCENFAREKWGLTCENFARRSHMTQFRTRL